MDADVWFAIFPALVGVGIAVVSRLSVALIDKRNVISRLNEIDRFFSEKERLQSTSSEEQRRRTLDAERRRSYASGGVGDEAGNSSASELYAFGGDGGSGWTVTGPIGGYLHRRTDETDNDEMPHWPEPMRDAGEPRT